MPLQTAVVGDTVAYRNADGDTTNVLVTGAQKAAPDDDDVTLTPAAAGGSLADDDYSYRVSVVDQGVESPASVAKEATVTGGGGSGQVTVDATAVLAAYPTATHWKLYGRTAAAEELIATTVRATPTFVDTGAVTPDGEPVAATGAIAFRNRMTKANQTQVPKATAKTDVNAYFKRL